jgi:hypothetical protein
VGQLVAMTGRHSSVIERWAHSADVELPDQHAHRVNVDFFRAWTPEMAYILGFVAADGCIRQRSTTSGSLEITLSARDRDLLVAIRDVMGIRRRISDDTTRQGFRRSRLGVGSLGIVEDLIALGIGPRKTASLDWPTRLPSDMASQFVLGYFDGDGTAAVARTHNHGHVYERLRIRLVGTYDFLERLAETVLDQVGRTGSLSQDKRSPNLWELSYIGSAAEAMGSWMYGRSEAPLRLERKRRIIIDYITSPDLRELRKGRLSFDDAEAIRSQWATGRFTQAELGSQYGVTASNISAIVRGKSFVKRHMVRV